MVIVILASDQMFQNELNLKSSDPKPMFESNTSIFVQINSPPQYCPSQLTWSVIGEACFVFLLIYFGDKTNK